MLELRLHLKSSLKIRKSILSKLAELKLQAESRSAELNTQIPNLKTFKGEMVGLEPTVIDSPREDQDGFFLPEVNDEVL